MKNIVVLISGSGSNLQAIIDACNDGQILGKVSAVFSNKADAYGLKRAEQSGSDTHFVNPKDFANRVEFDHALMQHIDNYQPDIIVLAGYMRILSAEFVEHYQGKMINVHPSLLPKYPGLDTHARAIEAGDAEHGTSVHFVTEELDGGPVILQANVPIFSGDTPELLQDRVQTQEHQIYPLVVKWLAEERLTMTDGKAVLDGKVLERSGYAQD
ncbi:phosphoribosylglycinamide formyltransferase [Vibrio tapetis subsp. quintayensis]|uniref:phosphoribosylglycinamide formyltransferase n=1 Tax=Vibrio tapetis TaxID=52443 RepID=UPI0025B5B6FF|nr:phosphoribosylglycinamide formyltransferase [Vibrio tapetis]MDN3682684.1 phosphoribosylglycinamide formyltransferase [Vibrio tapetis subsp. quintayensis]